MEWDMKLVGARIRAARKRMGLSQEKFGALIHLTSSYISRLELGKCKNVTVETLAYIARAIGMPLRDLLFGPDNAPDPEVELLLPDEPHCQECLEILRAADRLDAPQQTFFFQALWGILNGLQEEPVFVYGKVKQ